MFRHLLTAVFILTCFASALTKKPASNLAPPAISTSSGPAHAEPLPVRKVVLYKNGVGYFEHTGHVRGSQEVNVDFTTSQLNDVLKSLAVVDLGGGRVSSVRYNSVAPLNERLKTLRLPLDGQTNSYQFLNALRGAKVEVRTGATTAVGHLLSVERRQRRDKDTVTDYDQISIVSDTGDIRIFDLGSGTAVRILDRELSGEVSRYMDLVSSTREKDLRRMTVSTEGTGDRELFVSYISEVPVWKSTYRIIMPSKPGDKPTLQGWAIVDNTVGEDWNNVQLSLVAGAPQSFIQNLAQPYYTQRPVIALPESVQMTPQTHEGTLDEPKLVEEEAPPPVVSAAKGVVGGIGAGVGYGGGVFKAKASMPNGISGTVLDVTGAVISNAEVTVLDQNSRQVTSTRTNQSGTFSIPTPAGTLSIKITSPGFLDWRSSVSVASGQYRNLRATLMVGAATMAVEVSSGDLESSVEGSEAKPLAEMFEYRPKERVTIGKNQSALVPIINAKIEAEKVTLWTAGSEHPVRALWLANSSGLTLDAGTFNVIEQGSFGGEGVWELMKPDEKRLISYAAEDAIRIKSSSEEQDGRVAHVKIAEGVMTQTQQKETKTLYKLRNEDSAPRTVVIEHPIEEGWKLASDNKPAETTADYLRFKLTVPAKGTVELPVTEVKDEESTMELTNFNDREVALLIQRKSITPEMETAFRNVLAKKRVVNDLESQIGTRQREMTKITQDQNRLRENMKALKGSAEEKALLQRYTRDLSSQEDRLELLKKEVEQLETMRNTAQEELDKVIEGISFDTNL